MATVGDLLTIASERLSQIELGANWSQLSPFFITLLDTLIMYKAAEIQNFYSIAIRFFVRLNVCHHPI